ncbi:4Fe-4S binding protein [Gordonia soli]|uniref:ferredoxin--NADP(+) reductase n=1 Tax=Gordonia soli NBRC 108243 TaxID=1223545 RepID=M0QIP9_9ACTN|nr:4Fe-4S binding protein [Gordonia soli]GAC68176.1 putative ferredoxin--NADP(+) reductase [Gordonia soli NBRC 108243]
MTYVITQNCCKDASCVSVCPVDCIRPSDSSSSGNGPQMLFIDPDTCIDCGACYDECPVDAIHADSDLPPELEPFLELNAEYFRRNPLEPGPFLPFTNRPAIPAGALRVAIVGAGPAACYAAAELLAVGGVEVEMFERLPVPFGLVRYGVAPDHQHTKSITQIFDRALANKRFTAHLGVEVGGIVDHELLLEHHHAVVYAVGAPDSRELGLAGEDLPGHHAAAEFVAWYNGHPDHAAADFDLSTRTVVIVGNGNVALDVARVLLMDDETRASTDLAQHALDALADSAVEEVVLLGRRGPRHAAFSVGEFLALGHLRGVDIIIEGSDLDDGDLADDPDDDVETAAAVAATRDYLGRSRVEGNKRLVFRFLRTPVELEGSNTVEAIRLAPSRPDATGAASADERIETGLVLRSIGYRGRPIPGLPFDHDRGVVPNDEGRVIDDSGQPVPGAYVTGWIKRGPRGVIGTNRACAEQTVGNVFADHDAGTLDRGVADHEALMSALTERGADPVDWVGWRAIDRAEKSAGTESGRPRVKFVSIADMLQAARP